MITKSNLFPEIETLPDDLMNYVTSGDLNLRILNTLSGSTLMCYVMREMSDSFLVGLPCKLVKYGEKTIVEQYIPVGFMRIPFSALLGILPCFGEFEYLYINWLLENGNNLLPNYINANYIKRLQKRLEAFKENVEVNKSSLESIAAQGKEEPSCVIAPPESKYKH